MAGFWKIYKEPVQNGAITPAEAVVLADCQDWQGKDGKGCTLRERAARCGLSVEGVRKAIGKLQRLGLLSTMLTKSVNIVDKPCQHSRQNPSTMLTKSVNYVDSPPYPPNIEEQEKNIEEHRDESRAREEEFRQLGEVKKVDELADELREEIRNGGSFITNTMQMYGLNPQQTEEYLGWFLNHLGMGGTTLKSRGDFRRHFTNWLGIQVREQLKRQQNGTTKYSSRNENPTDLFTELG